MFVCDIEKEIQRNIETLAFDPWFDCAKERRPILKSCQSVDGLLREFKDRDAEYAERHNSIIEALIGEAQSHPHEAPRKILIFVFIPLLVRLAEGWKKTSSRSPEEVHASVLFHFLDVVAEFPLERLGARIFGNIRRRLEKRLRDEWVEERGFLAETEFLDACGPAAPPQDRDMPSPFEKLENRDSIEWLIGEARRENLVSVDDLEIIVRRDVHGVPLAALAKEMGLPVERLKKRRQRALAALRERFQEFF